jgi:tetratricopeptide (TPR) repeat protein
LGKKAFDPYVLKDLGIIYFNDGRYEEALSTLKGVASISENDLESLYYIGRSNMALGQYKEAVKNFDQLIEKDDYDNEILYFLGEAYDKQGDAGQAHYYLGVYYKKKNDVKNALFHLKKAFEYLKDDTSQEKKKAELSEMIQELSRKTKRNTRK